MTQEKSVQDDALLAIRQSGMLSPTDLSSLETLKDELQETFLNVQVFRTRTEMDVSVLNDLHYPTCDSKFWQSTREQDVQFTELVSLSFEARKNQVEIKKLQRSLESESDSLERELLIIEIEQRQFHGALHQRTAHNRIRELREWSEIKNQLKPAMEHGLTNVNDHQLVSYGRRFVLQYLNMGDNAPPADRKNIVGLMQTTLRRCKEAGLLEHVMPTDPQLQEQIAKEITEITG